MDSSVYIFLERAVSFKQLLQPVNLNSPLMCVLEKLIKLLSRMLQVERRMQKVNSISREGQFYNFAQVLPLRWVSHFFFVDVAQKGLRESGVKVLKGRQFLADQGERRLPVQGAVVVQI